MPLTTGSRPAWAVVRSSFLAMASSVSLRVAYRQAKLQSQHFRGPPQHRGMWARIAKVRLAVDGLVLSPILGGQSVTMV
jgi:hypothetical protein